MKYHIFCGNCLYFLYSFVATSCVKCHTQIEGEMLHFAWPKDQTWQNPLPKAAAKLSTATRHRTLMETDRNILH